MVVVETKWRRKGGVELVLHDDVNEDLEEVL